MKKGVLYFSIAVILASSLYAVYFYAMETGNVSPGKQEIEEEPVKGKGKRGAEGQPEGESEIKKEKTESGVAASSSFILKNIIRPMQVLNEQTGIYDIKDEVVDTIIINNEKDPELFTGTTFEELIKERTAEGLYYIIAAVKSEVNLVQKTDYYDAFQYMTYVFGSNFINETKNRYTEKLESFKSHPVSKAPILGTIDFYYITNSTDPAFIYFGSDFGLLGHPWAIYQRTQKVAAFFKANIPNEVIGPDEGELKLRAYNQEQLGEYFYRYDNQNAAYHFFELANMYPGQSIAPSFMALRYYKQGKYDEALAQLKLLRKSLVLDYFIRITKARYGEWEAVKGLIYYHTKDYKEALANFEQVLHGKIRVTDPVFNEATGQWEYKPVVSPEVLSMITEPLGKTYYHLHDYEKAWEYLKKVQNPSEDVKALLKELSEQRLQAEWQRIEKEGERR